MCLLCGLVDTVRFAVTVSFLPSAVSRLRAASSVRSALTWEFKDETEASRLDGAAVAASSKALEDSVGVGFQSPYAMN